MTSTGPGAGNYGGPGGGSTTSTGSRTEADAGEDFYQGRQRVYRDDDRQHWGREDDRRTRSDYQRRQERGIFISTEARHGFLTTEFWLTIVGVVGLVILAYNSALLGVRWGMGMATAILLGYVLSRGFAKAGSSETGRRDDDR